MSKERVLFELDQRVRWENPFDTMDKARAYDLDIRTSMIIPRQHLSHLVEPFVPAGTRVLEVGAGSGLLSLRLAACHPEAEFTAVESDDNLYTVLQDNAIFANLLEAGRNFNYESARPEKLPFDDGAFDLVISFVSLNRWDDPVRALAECRRVARPEGTVLVYDMARDSDHGLVSFVLQYAGDYGHEFMSSLRSSYASAEMERILEPAGLRGWQMSRVGIRLILSSRPIDAAYHIGMPGGMAA